MGTVFFAFPGFASIGAGDSSLSNRTGELSCRKVWYLQGAGEALRIRCPGASNARVSKNFPAGKFFIGPVEEWSPADGSGPSRRGCYATTQI